jgi:hypothetical protein
MSPILIKVCSGWLIASDYWCFSLYGKSEKAGSSCVEGKPSMRETFCTHHHKNTSGPAFCKQGRFVFSDTGNRNVFTLFRAY